MIIVGDACIELEFRPKLPENATAERQTEIMGALHKMLTEGQVYSGAFETRIEWSQLPSERVLLLRVRLPEGRIRIE